MRAELVARWAAARQGGARWWQGTAGRRVQVADWLRRRRWPVRGVAAVLVVGLGWALWPAADEPPPRARQYLEFTACLLTPERGVADPAAAPVWQGMQDASLATRAKVQYLAVTGPQTADNAATFLASLAQGKCGLVFVTGDAGRAALDGVAARFPTVSFFAVTPSLLASSTASPDAGTPSATRPNVTEIESDQDAQVVAAVGEAVTAAVSESA